MIEQTEKQIQSRSRNAAKLKAKAAHRWTYSRPIPGMVLPAPGGSDVTDFIAAHGVTLLPAAVAGVVTTATLREEDRIAIRAYEDNKYAEHLKKMYRHCAKGKLK